MLHSHTFSKKERLCNEIQIGKLFAEGTSFVEYPLRFVYQPNKQITNSFVKVLISVPKKKFKKAVHRNKIKRLIREAYRLNKPMWIDTLYSKQIKYNVAITYIAGKEFNLDFIQEKLIKGMKRIVEEAR